MQFRTLGRTGLQVSRLGLGTMTFGHPRWGADEAAADRIVGRFLEAGGNLIDTADSYHEGRSEEILGRVLRGRRHAVVLATKVAGPTGPGLNDIGLSRKHIHHAVDSSLRRLDTDYIDLYQVHAWDPTTPIDETIRALDALVRAGKVRYLGCSNFAAWQLTKANARAEALGAPRFDAIQLQYSLVCRHVEREHVPLCCEEGIALLPWSPLAGGVLAGRVSADGTPAPGSRMDLDAGFRGEFVTPGNQTVAALVRELAKAGGCSPARLALAWLLARPGVTAPIIGARSVEQLEDNLAALTLAPDPGALARLEAATALPLVHPYDQQAAIRGMIATLDFEW
jgi:aryl-alcohol dehydrogenase-like predicted oxidoreductase